MEVFYLKERDTLPVLEVVLKNPDGTVFDLSGSTAWKLHIFLADGTTRLVRTMTKVGADVEGTLRYAWITSDWAVASSADADGSYQVGGLVVGPTLPLLPTQREHRMEYEVYSLSTRLTFPNGGVSVGDAYHVLRIWNDIGQGA